MPQISFELKIPEHNVKKRIVFSGSISNNFASKAKHVQILNMSRFTLFGDQTFRGRICMITLVEISILFCQSPPCIHPVVHRNQTILIRFLCVWLRLLQNYTL